MGVHVTLKAKVLWKEQMGFCNKDWENGRKIQADTIGLLDSHSIILSMNHSYCRSHKKTPYELVYGDKPHGGCTLIEDLFGKGIYDEENIPETIKINDYDYLDENLDDDLMNEQDEQGICLF